MCGVRKAGFPADRPLPRRKNRHTNTITQGKGSCLALGDCRSCLIGVTARASLDFVMQRDCSSLPTQFVSPLFVGRLAVALGQALGREVIPTIGTSPSVDPLYLCPLPFLPKPVSGKGTGCNSAASVSAKRYFSHVGQKPSANKSDSHFGHLVSLPEVSPDLTG